jgi:hypothetical protein
MKYFHETVKKHSKWEPDWSRTRKAIQLACSYRQVSPSLAPNTLLISNAAKFPILRVFLAEIGLISLQSLINQVDSLAKKGLRPR